MSKKKIFTIIIMTVLLIFLNIHFVEARTNKHYGSVSPVNDTAVSSAVSQSSLLGLLARLVYAIGTMIEWLTSIIFQSLTGTNDFPWADKIVFNAVPMLDVNYIDPEKGSFVGNTDIARVIKNMYSTILAIASGFFGIIVMITSIKLVISTIAEEKAKYKKAITDWLIGFVMLFCIHYLLSFIFYLNETLVTVASQIAVAQYKGTAEKMRAQNSEFAKDILNNMGDDLFTIVPGSTYHNKPIKDILSENVNLLEKWTTFTDTLGLNGFLMKTKMISNGAMGTSANIIADINREESQQRQHLALIFAWALERNITVSRLQEIANNNIVGVEWETKDIDFEAEIMEADLLKEIYGIYWDYIYSSIIYNGNTPEGRVEPDIGSGNCHFWPNSRSKESYFDSLESNSVRVIASRGLRGICTTDSAPGQYNFANVTHYSTYAHHSVLDELIQLKLYAGTGDEKMVEGVVNKKVTNINFLITDLSIYFKVNAYERKVSDTGAITMATKTDNVYPQNMIMFAVLVIQSIILFIAYVKRLFYVLLLGLMAPVVVVFDFFQRFGK